MNEKAIAVETVVKAPVEKVWEYWNKPEHIVHWAFAADDWEAPKAENDLRVGGKFKTVMAAKDGSAGFDFGGTYTDVKKHALIEYDMDPASGEKPRHVKVEFKEVPEGVKVIVTFDPENENPVETQRDGWQAISDNFKKYVEGS
jgi:uncharacterized protein YndB with AHSA1/START domain